MGVSSVMEPQHRFTYRASKNRSGGPHAARDHRYTLELVDEAPGTAVAHCSVHGTPVHKPQLIRAAGSGEWTIRPNRRVMPSHWILVNPQGRETLLLDQRIFGKLAGPLTRVGMTIKNPQGTVLYRVVEPEASLGERLLGPDPDAWTVENDDGPVALIATLPKPDVPATGWRGKLQRFIQGSDMGLVSLGDAHRFGAAEALAILLIFRELRDISKSAE
jgi:hypothetical protein